ncbi:unnamed protein product [Caenorhabditis auriculariae]|uniref:Uncharacterized protein n=1 Tax=Caenorhabditis auriculariae TaxID=2777116 RepID=A0A8S1GYV3_9PELO|nr:unnamed protein product [Caenorhabditis auriculariae]
MPKILRRALSFWRDNEPIGEKKRSVAYKENTDETAGKKDEEGGLLVHLLGSQTSRLSNNLHILFRSIIVAFSLRSLSSILVSLDYRSPPPSEFLMTIRSPLQAANYANPADRLITRAADRADCAAEHDPIH